MIRCKGCLCSCPKVCTGCQPKRFTISISETTKCDQQPSTPPGEHRHLYQVGSADVQLRNVALLNLVGRLLVAQHARHLEHDPHAVALAAQRAEDAFIQGSVADLQENRRGEGVAEPDEKPGVSVWP